MSSTKLNQLIDLIKQDFMLLLSIAVGVFLFILFFQPFPLERFDFNNRLIFVAGLGGIIFFFMLVIRIIVPWSVQSYKSGKQEIELPSYVGGFTILTLSSIGFAFYLNYVGLVTITFHIMFKVVLICLAPPVALRLYDVIHELRQQNILLIKEQDIIQRQIDKCQEEQENKPIEFLSENSNEKINLYLIDVAFIKSADNYVEIVYKEGDELKKKMIRNTLKHIEHQLKLYPAFVRCHRTFIVNTLHVESLQRKINNHILKLKGYKENIPVSRQYLLKLKEAI
jgi:DNA-binding LytR/AlgR family response regulator